MNENNLKVKATSKVKAVSNDNVVVFDQRKFISDIYECEKQLYILDARLRELFVKRTVGPTDFPKDFKKSVQYKNYCKEYKKKKPLPKKPEEPDLFNWLVWVPVFTVGGVALGTVIDIIIDIIKGKIVTAPGFYIIVFALIAGIVFSLCGYFSDSNDYKAYLNNVESIKNQNADIVKHNNERYKYWEDEYYREKQLARKSFDENECIIIDNEADRIRQIKAEVKSTLNELYNLRIDGVLCLHPNYMGLIPISIIYGYFDTGRCSQLQGHEGAYNLYEDEKMKGMIISKLDTVSQQLGQLNNTMVYVGKAIEECNERLSELESSSERMISSVNSMNSNVTKQLNGVSNQMSAIESNTANGAYYAEIGAKMATFNTVYNMLKD